MRNSQMHPFPGAHFPVMQPMSMHGMPPPPPPGMLVVPTQPFGMVSVLNPMVPPFQPLGMPFPAMGLPQPYPAAIASSRLSAAQPQHWQQPHVPRPPRSPRTRAPVNNNHSSKTQQAHMPTNTVPPKIQPTAQNQQELGQQQLQASSNLAQPQAGSRPQVPSPPVTETDAVQPHSPPQGDQGVTKPQSAAERFKDQVEKAANASEEPPGLKRAFSPHRASNSVTGEHGSPAEKFKAEVALAAEATKAAAALALKPGPATSGPRRGNAVHRIRQKVQQAALANLQSCRQVPARLASSTARQSHPANGKSSPAVHAADRNCDFGVQPTYAPQIMPLPSAKQEAQQASVPTKQPRSIMSTPSAGPLQASRLHAEAPVFHPGAATNLPASALAPALSKSSAGESSLPHANFVTYSTDPTPASSVASSHAAQQPQLSHKARQLNAAAPAFAPMAHAAPVGGAASNTGVLGQTLFTWRCYC